MEKQQEQRTLRKVKTGNIEVLRKRTRRDGKTAARKTKEGRYGKMVMEGSKDRGKNVKSGK